MPATIASGSVASPWAVAQVDERSPGCRCSQRALRIGYQVQHATAPSASDAPSASLGPASGADSRSRASSAWLTSTMPAAIVASEGASRPHGSDRSDRFEATAITTGSVPISIVGSGTPAIWIAAARNA